MNLQFFFGNIAITALFKLAFKTSPQVIRNHVDLLSSWWWFCLNREYRIYLRLKHENVNLYIKLRLRLLSVRSWHIQVVINCKILVGLFIVITFQSLVCSETTEDYILVSYKYTAVTLFLEILCLFNTCELKINLEYYNYWPNLFSVFALLELVFFTAFIF